MKAHVLSGLDQIALADKTLHGRRLGLMTNPTGFNRSLRSTIDILNEKYSLTALFACEHGIRGDAQAGDYIATYTDPETGVTVYSVYGEANRHLTKEMLGAFDVFVFDMQEVGSRFYTYLYSLAYAMEDCAAAGKPVVVLDRINPLGGIKRGGTVIDPAFDSFVGDYELPTRYGLTMGEFARYVKAYLKLDLSLTVAPLSGWTRKMYLDDTDLCWTAPSPNCPTLSSALCFTGTCVFEGTNVSEGRGTTMPFELIGAPWIDSKALSERMNALCLPGVGFRRAAFRPTFSKHAGSVCCGVQMHVTDREVFDSFEAGLRLLETIWQMYPNKLEFLRWEETSPYSLDLLLGDDAFRTGRLDAKGMVQKHAPRVNAFSKMAAQHLMYE